ncbi:uncharacterized protein LOC131336289 [Rhododendron vialii]|uniref:uncharacterized protein LOC131336289 n=1 Tax=Rhododendron vialii TaxID=182163 RepID=UPI00265ED120|nr:uncharacterized protein LOC131336289 [Rhododendron vialii]
MKKLITFLHLFIVLLCLSSHLLSLNAGPVTRTRSLMLGSKLEYGISENTHLVKTEGKMEEERIEIRRVDVELNDYPGSGPNNRHTPSPKLGRGCVDC